jgi:hypothetical protein
MAIHPRKIRTRTDTLTHRVISVNGVHGEFDAEITEQVGDELGAGGSM